MKKSEEDRLKCVVYESTRAPLTRSPFPNGEGYDTGIPLSSTQRLSQGGKQRGGGFAAQKESQPRLATLGSPFQGKGRRLDGGSGMNWNIDSIGLFNIARYTASMPLLPLALPPKGEARRYIANDFLNLIALPQGGRLNRQRLRREYIGGRCPKVCGREDSRFEFSKHCPSERKWQTFLASLEMMIRESPATHL